MSNNRRGSAESSEINGGPKSKGGHRRKQAWNDDLVEIENNMPSPNEKDKKNESARDENLKDTILNMNPKRWDKLLTYGTEKPIVSFRETIDVRDSKFYNILLTQLIFCILILHRDQRS